MASTHQPSRPVAVIEKDDEDLRYESQAMIASSAYTYDQLPGPRAFRVLRLLPGPAHKSLEITLETVRLDDPSVESSYIAISYTRGASRYDRLYVALERIPDTHEIHGRVDIRHPIYDSVSKKRLLVSTNLYNLLRRLRDPSASTILWI